ncbi:YggT family protein [Laceyella sediminis]|jgi:YggT family protein|uniref:YggT family protein n=1 Tax=Laceyella sediminis TaxID=573074 RepID=A0ABX5EUT0_9BACL|nr:YggT family protein [Laceyella sediminis]PRZ16966.1 YggT family protein [Laceyella sediminis]
MLIYQVVDTLFTIYQFVLIIYILASWLPQVFESPVGQLLARLSEPYLSVFRRFIPPIGFIDISPIVALFALHFIRLGVMTIISWVI